MGVNESLVLDGLDLSDGTAIGLEAVTFPPPPRKPEWATGADADGPILVRDPVYDARTVTMDLRPLGATMASSLQTVGDLIVGKLQKASQSPEGIPLVWTPAGQTLSVTLYVLLGEITEFLQTWESGYFSGKPLIGVTLTCRPFAYGTEVAGPSATGSTPILTVTVPNVPGDVPAEGRLVITDLAGVARRHVEWGLQRNYDPNASLEVDSGALVIAGYAGTRPTPARAGAHNAAPVRANLYFRPISCCATAPLPHVGRFRAKARVYVSATTVSLRLVHKAGDGPLTPGPWVTAPLAGRWCEVELGSVTVTKAGGGTQAWTGRVEAQSSNPSGDTLDIDYLLLIPVADGYGKARAPAAPVGSGSFVARDDFQSLAYNAVLNGRVAQAGGTWVTSGAATDFTGWNGGGFFPGTAGSVQRSTASDAAGGRYAQLGTVTYGEVEVGGDFWSTSIGAYGVIPSLVARRVDASNYIRLRKAGGGNTVTLILEEVIGGTSRWLATVVVPTLNQVWIRLGLIVRASGTVYAYVNLRDSDTRIADLTGYSTACQTGGSLATGYAGFSDENSGTSTGIVRCYDDPTVAIPDPESIVINPNEALQVTAGDAIRADPTGTVWGQPPTYRGSRFYLPQAGDLNQVSRVLVKVRRNDVEEAEDTIGDNTTAAVFYTPRYLAVPH